MSDTYDVICIGGGTVSEAVTDALQGSGLSIAVIEKELVGGECPYWGCMPSKSLLRSAETLAEARRARTLAASRVEADVDFARIAKRTHEIARNLDDTNPTKALVEQGADVIRGSAELLSARTVRVGERTLTASRAVVIGTGTSALIPPISGIDSVDIWTNREATLAEQLPASLVVLGGGPIGLELGQAYARFGVTVTIIEAADRVLSSDEPEASAALAAAFEAEGITVRAGVKAETVARDGAGVAVTLSDSSVIRGERLLVATGRTPRLDGLDLDAAGVRRTERGWIAVDGATLEAAPGVFAGGDITGIGAFTHLSWYHGHIIGNRIRGGDARADHRAIPRVTFTDPEVGSVGLSEKAARDQGIPVRVVSDTVGNGARGYINGEPDGVIKLVADSARGVLVGACCVGPRSGEIVSELTLAIRAEVPLGVLADTLHPFPTFSRLLDGLFAKLAV
jgi:pyruvate/2-oxoglutarate dehydrogenase complex dihydrolipoamide dehydrogenase (E3) component